MGKVIKNVVKTAVWTISTLFVLLITLLLLASLLLNLPIVQNAVADRLMSGLSKKLGTTVSIDRVNIKFINRAVVEGFYVEDLRGDTLLYVPRLVAPVIEPGLAGKPLAFGKVKLERAGMWLRCDSAGVMNIREVMQAIRGGRPENPNPGSKFRMYMEGIEADSLTFGLLRRDKPPRDGMDFSRFVVRNAQVDIDALSVEGGTVRIGIRSLSFDERSGMHLDNLSAHDLVVSEGLVALDNVKIHAGGADLDVPRIRIQGGEWTTYKRSFIDSVAVNVTMRSSHVTTDFIGWFAPAVKDWGITLDDLSAQTLGPVAAMSGSIGQARTLYSSLALDFTSRGMPDIENTHFEATVRSVETTGRDIDSLVYAITGKRLPETVAAPLRRLGDTGFKGKFSGSLDDFEAQGTLASNAGRVDAVAKIQMRGATTTADGILSIREMNIGKVMAINEMGMVSGDFALNGTLEKGGRIKGDIEGEIGTLEILGYPYSGISLDGRMEGRVFDGTLRAADPALDFDLSGMFDAGDSIPRYNLSLDLRRADLVRTGLDRRDSVSLLSGRMTASGAGRGLDELNGTIRVMEPVYISSADTVETGLITVTGRNSAGSKYIALRSEFADAEFRSRISYRDMFSYLGDFLSGYVPTLDGEGAEKPLPAIESAAADAANYSMLNLDVKNTDRLLDALMPGTRIAPQSTVSFMFNPFIRNFSLSAHSEFIEYRGVLATGIELNSDNKADSLTLHLTGQDIYSGAMHIPAPALHGGSKRGKATVSTRLTDSGDNFSAMLGLRIDSEQEGKRDRLRFRFTPSYISLDKKTWYIRASSVVYDTTRVAVEGLRIFSEGDGGEELAVNGVISRSAADTLHIALRNFDLSPLGRLVENNGYRLNGRADGNIDFMSLRSAPRMIAGIDFRGLSLNGIEAAPLRFTSVWDSARERMRFNVLNQNNNANVLRGSLSPSDGSIDAVAQIDALDAGLLDPLLGGVLENTEGRADLMVEAGGSLSGLRLNGRIDVPRFATTVKYTRVRYSLEGGAITVDNSRLRLPPTIVRDAMGNTADFSLSVDMSNLKNVGVDINADVRNLLAVDTGPGDNEAFYGRVFATGSLGIRTDRMGTRMGISATTERGTVFHLPLNAKSNISWADFVVRTDPGRANTDSLGVLARKKLLYERRLERGRGRTERTTPLDLDITVDLTPDAQFHMLIDPNLGNGISAHGSGVINMRINPATDLFSMVGDCTINDGRFDFSMMDAFNKEFTITPGSTLVWTGEPEDALLGIEASYRLRTSLSPLIGSNSTLNVGGSTVPVDCVLRLSERLSQPEITFDVRLPSADPDAQLIAGNAMNTQELKSTQFLSLLMIGGFASDNSISGQSVNSGALATGAVGLDIFTNQLSNFLSSEDYNVYFRYRPQSDLLGNQFDVGFSTAFIDNRLLLEIEGNYVDDRAAMSMKADAGKNALSNLAGDVSLTWVIDRAGNLRLKVFSQTIDRLNETQGLQESGLGIYYKKDFDSLGDIWRKNRKSFVNFGADSVGVKQPRKIKR